MPHHPPQALQDLIAAQPDLVDRIFDYLLEEIPALAGDAETLQAAQDAVRSEFGGATAYIGKASPQDRSKTAREVLRMFNGRNATEVARKLNISRASVYRFIKQSGVE